MTKRNTELNSPDIKPKRSETLASRKRRNIGGSSLLFISFLSLINIIGLVVLALWFFNSSGYQQQAGQSFIERISMLEEKISEEKLLWVIFSSVIEIKKMVENHFVRFLYV